MCQNDITWKSLSEYICLEIWIYLIRIFSRPLTFNTFVYQNFLLDKIIKTEALCDSLLDTSFVSTLISYTICLWGGYKISHPAYECPVLAHFGPAFQESVVRTSPYSPFQWTKHSLHDLDNGQTASFLKSNEVHLS